MFQDETCVSLKTSIPEIQANYSAAELLMADDKFLDLVAQDYAYSQIACSVRVHKDLAIIKAQLLNSRGHNLSVPYVPGADFWGKI